MTLPAYPSANPGGEDTWIMRQALHDWLKAQRLPGVTSIQLTLQPMNFWEEFTGSGGACMLMIHVTGDREQLVTSVGPDNPGGREVHYSFEVHIKHRGTDPDDWAGSQRAYDRVKDSIKQALRGQGAAIGRPDVVFQAGIWDDGIQHTSAEPAVNQDGGYVDRWGMVAFTISQYLPDFIPAVPA